MNAPVPELSAHKLFCERASSVVSAIPTLDPLPRPRGSVVITGIGGSEGPARTHAVTLRDLGYRASFVPLSGLSRAFADELRIFSQGLSPNAQMALQQAPRFTSKLLITAQSQDCPMVRAFIEQGGKCAFHGPEREEGLLARVVGPTIASYLATGVTPEPTILVKAHERGAAVAANLSAASLQLPVAFFSCGDDGERYFGLRWKWMETLGTCDPPVYDVLNFIHGPFQLWFERPVLCVTLRQPSDDPGLWSAFERLVQPQQRLVTLAARASGARAFFEHDVMVNALLSRALELHVGHSCDWRGKGKDGALYKFTGSEQG
jgi:hypothetical protein